MKMFKTQAEESIYQALPLTGTLDLSSDLEACHRMRWKDWVIVRFPSKKKETTIFVNRKI